MREVISQAPAVSSIQPPMLETIEAIQRSRNKELRSGLQAEFVMMRYAAIYFSVLGAGPRVTSNPDIRGRAIVLPVCA
ncbi:MAG: hypothetical protein ACYT04_45630, partial [Nostoc sp.]